MTGSVTTQLTVAVDLVPGGGVSTQAAVQTVQTVHNNYQQPAVLFARLTVIRMSASFIHLNTNMRVI